MKFVASSGSVLHTEDDVVHVGDLVWVKTSEQPRCPAVVSDRWLVE